MSDHRLSGTAISVLAALILGYAASGIVLAGDGAGAPAVSLARLEQLNRGNAEQVRTAVVTEIVTHRVHALPDQEDNARLRLTEAITQQGELSTQQAVAGGASKAALGRLDEDQADELASIDRALLVSRLNRSRVTRRVRTIDFQNSRARYDDADLRDLDLLVAQHGLTGSERDSLDQSASLLLRADYPGIRLVPHVGRLAIIGVGPRYDADGELCNFGIIPSWAFLDEYKTELSASENGEAPTIQLVGHDHGCILFVIVVRPDLGFRMTHLTTFDAAGAVAEEFSASDFREIEGAFVPFRTLKRRAREGVADYSLRHRSVQSVSLNAPLRDAEESFAIPPEYRIRDITKATRSD